jgi:CRP-like cAMP-binding protein
MKHDNTNKFLISIQNWLKEVAHVSNEELLDIYQILETTHFESNDFIIKQGQVANKIGLLIKGSIRVYVVDMEGNEKTIKFIFENEPLMLIDSFFKNVPSSVNSIALEPTTIVWTDFKRYSDFINKYPKYNTIFLSALANWAKTDKERFNYLYLSTAKEKYVEMLKTHPQIIERVPLKYVASYLSITQYTLSRIRGKK